MKKYIEYVGRKIGDLSVLEELDPHITPNGTKQRIVRCKCSCGKEITIGLQNAKKNGKCTDCKLKSNRNDLTGKKYGKLTVISMADDYYSPSGHRLSRCRCLCDCGKECTVNMSALITGSTQSCGCNYNTAGLLKDNESLISKYDFEKNEGIDINSLTARSNKKVWWKCNNCGNSWYATISSQNDKTKHGCPYCSGRLVIKGKNDLLSQYPDLVRDSWNYRKNTVDPSEISCFSGKKVWWKCKEGHEWNTTVANRVNGTGCPQCNIENVNSFCEQAVYYYIKKVFPDAINGDRHLGIEFDIYIPSVCVAIEYDGEAWHNFPKKIATDKYKNDVCNNNKIEMIRIREPRLGVIDNCTVFKRADSTSNSTLDEVICNVIYYLSPGSHVDVDTTRDTGLILEQFATKKYENSLLFLQPDIAAEWHPTKNGKLTPEKVNKGSRYMVWWLGKCGHEWQMKVCDRTKPERIDKNGKTRKPQGCPYCNGKKVLLGFNDLKSQRPDLLSYWDYKKNDDVDPGKMLVKSSKKVWWKCSKGHSWLESPNGMFYRKGCPECYKKERSPAVMCEENGKVYENAVTAAKELGIKSSGSIYGCCRGLKKTAGGFHWKYWKGK